MRKLLTVTATALLLVGCNVQNVDVTQSTAIATKFYGALEQGDGKTALAQFSPIFKTQAQQWPRLLGGPTSPHFQ